MYAASLSAQEFSRQVTYSEGQRFAERMSSLFIEASAKTAVGVSEAFQEVVEKILDTPELWAPIGQKGMGMGATATSADGGMPGSINLGDSQNAADTQNSGGCGC